MGHRTGSRRASRGPIAKDTVDEAEIVAALAMGVVVGGGEIRGSGAPRERRSAGTACGSAQGRKLRTLDLEA